MRLSDSKHNASETHTERSSEVTDIPDLNLENAICAPRRERSAPSLEVRAHDHCVAAGYKRYAESLVANRFLHLFRKRRVEARAIWIRKS